MTQICFNTEDLEHRMTAAIERVDRRIMAAAAAKGEFDDLFDEANNTGRRAYVMEIIEELTR